MRGGCRGRSSGWRHAGTTAGAARWSRCNSKRSTSNRTRPPSAVVGITCAESTTARPSSAAASGHFQHVVSMQLDCDRDTLLLRVRQDGVACHLDRMSCFEEVVYGDTSGTMAIVNELQRVIQDRKANPKEGSYTNKLLTDEDKRLKKLVEEAAETVLAAKGKDMQALTWEVADLIYHLMVVLEAAELPMEDVYRKLAERRK